MYQIHFKLKAPWNCNDHDQITYYKWLYSADSNQIIHNGFIIGIFFSLSSKNLFRKWKDELILVIIVVYCLSQPKRLKLEISIAKFLHVILDAIPYHSIIFQFCFWICKSRKLRTKLESRAKTLEKIDRA